MNNLFSDKLKWFIFLITFFLSFLFPAMDIWPGLIDKLVFQSLLILIILPVLTVWFLLVVTWAGWEFFSTKHGKRPGLGVLSLGIILSGLILVGFHVPQRLAFQTALPAFSEWVQITQVDQSMPPEPLFKAGLFQIDEIRIDPRGGVFFRTLIGPDGLGPDQKAYGFVFQPNQVGSPFGNSRYHQFSMGGEWYSFSVSDD